MPSSDWNDYVAAYWLVRREHEAQGHERVYEPPLYVPRSNEPTRRLSLGQLRRQHGTGYARRFR